MGIFDAIDFVKTSTIGMALSDRHGGRLVFQETATVRQGNIEAQARFCDPQKKQAGVTFGERKPLTKLWLKCENQAKKRAVFFL